jgi:molybdate transport system regulatory protein
VNVHASILLRGDSASAIGRERMRLLEAVARHGSITAGAKAVGLTYKAAWDALDAMANLFGVPLLETRTGGPAGGGACLTPAGARVVEAFHRLEAELTRVLRELKPELAGTGIGPNQLMSGFLMRTSARNALRGTIKNVHADALTAEVAIRISEETTIYAIVTNESVGELGLVPGRDAIVLIKAPFVIIAPGEKPPATSIRNCVQGTVQRCERSDVSAEVVLDIGGGKTLAATITAHSAKALGLKKGRRAWALFEASHVIIAID